MIISLALAENQIAAQIELFRKFKQGLLTYQRRAQLGQFALGKLGAMLENIVRNDNRQDRIPEKFQTLVILDMLRLVLVCVGGMRQGFPEQVLILKAIADFIL